MFQIAKYVYKTQNFVKYVRKDFLNIKMDIVTIPDYLNMLFVVNMMNKIDVSVKLHFHILLQYLYMYIIIIDVK